ncbi:MAG: bacteriohemerythrin [Magnetospiraceae bacterium]
MMREIQWSEAMSVGVAALDEDHKILVGLIGRLRDAADHNEGQAIRNALDTLISYTGYHFLREEKVMAASKYPGLAHHAEEHRALEKEVYALQARFEENDPNLTIDLIHEFLVGWLNHHILLNDMHYRRYCEENPEAIRAAEALGALKAPSAAAAT